MLIISTLLQTERTVYLLTVITSVVAVFLCPKRRRIVKQYEWELAEWKQQVEGKPAEEKKPPERRSVLEKLHRIHNAFTVHSYFSVKYIIAQTFRIVIDNSGIIMEFCYALRYNL